MELADGGTAGEVWPRPGRVFAVSTGHTLHEPAEAIDDGFARWDRGHLHEFEFPTTGKRAVPAAPPERPWPNAPSPVMTTLRCPGRYTRLTAARPGAR